MKKALKYLKKNIWLLLVINYFHLIVFRGIIEVYNAFYFRSGCKGMCEAIFWVLNKHPKEINNYLCYVTYITRCK